MIKRPSREQIATASEWLSCNEGDGGEALACRAVAEWILAIDDDHQLRQKARQAGVTVTRLRRAITEQKQLRALRVR